MRRQAGLTLIEILVAASLLALLGVLGWRGLDASARTSARVESSAARWQAIALACERLGNDVRQAVGVPGRDADGRETPAWVQPAGATEVTLTRSGDDGDSPRRVTYRWRDGRLELLTWPAFDAPAASRSHVLLEAIAGVEFAVLDPALRWHSSWSPQAAQRLPRALRLRLQLAEGGTIERIFDVAAAP